MQHFTHTHTSLAHQWWQKCIEEVAIVGMISLRPHRATYNYQIKQHAKKKKKSVASHAGSDGFTRWIGRPEFLISDPAARTNPSERRVRPTHRVALRVCEDAWEVSGGEYEGTLVMAKHKT